MSHGKGKMKDSLKAGTKKRGRFPPAVMNQCMGCKERMSGKELKRHKC